MDAKSYLSQIRMLNIKINHKQQEVDDLKILATCTGSVSGQSPDRIISSPSGDALEKKIIRFVQLEEEINKDIDQLVNIKHQIINQIHFLNDTRYVDILYKRYVEFKKFELISIEMGYDYDWIRKLHTEALKTFEDKFPHILTL